MAITAVYPGTFDPITNGHLDIIRRASKMFDRVILAIADNPEKGPLFSLEERKRLAEENLTGIDHVTVVGFSGLLIDLARSTNSSVILRGLRAVSDFEYEFQLASMNRKLDPEIETLFLTPTESFTFVSASLVKEIARHGGDVSKFVGPNVLEALQAKFGN